MTKALPICAGLLAAVLYLLTAQRAFYDDGIRFEFVLRAGDLAYIHLLYLPIVALVRDVLSIGEESALKVTAAIFGGLGVGMTIPIARRVVPGGFGAGAAALLLAGLLGYWFHSTTTELHAFHAGFACFLLLALVGIAAAPERVPAGWFVLLFAGAFVTPASHASGVATALPILVAFLCLRGQRVGFAAAVILGFGLWVAIYLFFYLDPNSSFQGYSGAQSDKLPRLLADPGLLPGKLQAVAAELFLYSVPASALVPAGFLVLRRRAPRVAWMLLAWILSWAILALPVGDRAYGSNFIATLPAQAILGTVALRAAGGTPLRMVLVAVFAFLALPASFLFGELGGLVGLGVGAIACCCATGPERDRVRWPYLVHGLLFVSSGVMMALLIPRDPIRDYLHQVASTVGPDAVVVYLEKVPNTHMHWLRYFPGADGDDPRAFNPYFVESLKPNEVAPVLDGYRARIRRQVEDKGRIFYVETSLGGLQHLNYPQQLAAFVGELHRDFHLVDPPGGIPRLKELLKK